MSIDTAAPAEKWHGTANGYVRHGCRCDECTAANASRARDYYARKLVGLPRTPKRKAQAAEQRKRRFEQGLPDPDDKRHGTLNGYSSWGCRCTRCTATKRIYANRRRQAQRNERKQ